MPILACFSVYSQYYAHGHLSAYKNTKMSFCLQRAKLDSAQRSDAVLEGDVLRACTCINMVYQTNALFGAQPPTRTVVVFGADNQKWPEVSLLGSFPCEQCPFSIILHWMTLLPSRDLLQKWMSDLQKLLQELLLCCGLAWLRSDWIGILTVHLSAVSKFWPSNQLIRFAGMLKSYAHVSSYGA